MLRVEEIVWQSSPGEDSQGSSFIFTSEKVAYSSSCFCILQRGWLNSAKTEEYSLLCWPCWEKQTNSCAFAWSRSWACQEAVLASKRVCQCSVLAFSSLTYLWGISPPPQSQCFLSFLLFIVLPSSALLYYAFPSPCLYKFPSHAQAASLCTLRWRIWFCLPRCLCLCSTTLGLVTCKKAEGGSTTGLQPMCCNFSFLGNAQAPFNKLVWVSLNQLKHWAVI